VIPDAPPLRLSTQDWQVHAFAEDQFDSTLAEALCGEGFLCVELDEVADVAPSHIPCVLKFAAVVQRYVDALRAVGGLVGES